MSVRLDGATVLNLANIANENITLVRVGDKLVILFDNKSTITIEPVFDASGQFQDIAFQLSPDRVVTGTEFAGLFPITTDQSILPAAGNAPASGANFSDHAAIDALGGGNPLALLNNLDGGGDGGLGGGNPGTNTVPIIGAIQIGNTDDEGLPEGNLDGPGDVPGADVSITISLNIDWGQDVIGRTLAFSPSQPGLTGLTSAGQPISIFSTTIGGLPALIGYTGADPNDPAHQVFTITLDAGPINGQYTFTLKQPLDHPIAGTEDTIALFVNFIATDGNGDSANGTFQVNVNDDSPEIGAPGAPTVSEDNLDLTVTDTLAIEWGADNDTSLRSVGFTFPNPSAGDNVDVTDQNGVPLTLYSNGQLVSFTILSGVLVGYTGAVPLTPSDPNVVLTVSLSSVGDGSYTLELLQPLDHPPPVVDEHFLDLTISYTATDADGDPVTSEFTVRVDAAGTINAAGDTISYATLNTGVFINLDDSARTIFSQTVAANTATDEQNVLDSDKVVGIDQLGTVIVNATGSAGDDIIVGGDEANILEGRGGADLIFGRAGDDQIAGGAGQDEIYGGRGNDTIDGGSGADFIAGGRGNDILDGNGGDDHIHGNRGDDTIRGGDGDDLLEGNDGDDTIRGGDGSDALFGGLGNDRLRGGNGADLVVGDDGNDLLFGEDGQDDLYGGDGEDTIDGGDGADLIYGEAGDDQITGGAGQDEIYGGRGNDTIDGGGNADFIAGGRGDDIIDGNDGADHIHGNRGDDTIRGGDGDDLLEGNGGDDTIDGGAGWDEIYGDGGDDTIDGGAGADFISGGRGNDILDGSGGDDHVHGGRGDDLIRGGGADDLLEGNAGDDEIWGGAGVDMLVGGGDPDSTADRLLGNAGDDTLYGNETDLSVAANKFAQVGENDVAAYSGDAPDYSVTWDGGLEAWQITRVTAGGEGAGSIDTLFGIEGIDFNNDGSVDLDLTAAVFVFNNGSLVGTFDTITEAVGLANTLTPVVPGGLLIEAGHNGTTSFAEGAISITQAMTIQGVGPSRIDIGATGSILFTVDAGVTGGVTFQNLALQNSGGADYGIRFNGAHDAGVGSGGVLTIDDVSIGGFDQDGLFVNGGGTSRSVTITGSEFAGNGGNATSGGSGDVLFFEFTGDATLTNVVVTGFTGTGVGSADHGIQFAGFLDSTDAVTNAIGTVVFNNVTAQGAYEKTLVFVQGYSDFSNLDLSGGLFLGDPGTPAQTGWTTLFIDGAPIGPGYVDPDAGNPSAVDLTGVQVLGWTYAGALSGFFAQIAAAGAQLHVTGTIWADDITGSDDNDSVFASLSNDTINTGDGDDLIIYLKDDGADTVDGGDGTDTQVVVGTGTPETFDITAVGSTIDIDIDIDSAQALTLTGIDEIVVQTGPGGDTVNISGDFGTTDLDVSTITVEGGAGADEVNAGGLTSEHRVVFTGAGGDDRFISGAGNDTFDGGSEIDTAVYNAVLSTGATFNFDGDHWTVSIGGLTDTLIGVERVEFADATFLLVDHSGIDEGGFQTIQEAVDHATGGETVLIAPGTYVEQVQVEGSGKDGLTLQALTAGTVTVEGPATLAKTADSPTSGRDLVSLIEVDGADNVTIKDIRVDGQQRGGDIAAAPDNGTLVGIAYLNSDGGIIDGVTVTGIRESEGQFGNQRGVGIYVVNTNPSPALPNTPADAELPGLNSIEIKNSTVEDFQKGGIVVAYADVNIHDNIVTGHGPTSNQAQNGIQVSGSTGTVQGNTVTAIGYTGAGWASTGILTYENVNLVIDGNTVTGTGSTHLTIGVGVFDSRGVSVTDNDFSDLQWAIDVEDYPTAFGWPDALLPGGGTVFTGNTFVNIGDTFLYFNPDSATTQAFFVGGTSGYDAIFGAAGDDTLLGQGGDDYLEGRGGADEIHGGAGSDTIVHTVGDGSDIVDGGFEAPAGTDVLQVTNTGGATAFTVGMAVGGTNIVPDTGTDSTDIELKYGATTIRMDEIEDIVLDLGAGGDTVNLLTPLGGTSLHLTTVSINGGAGADEVDAGGLTSEHRVVFTGAGGDDRFISGAGNDTFDGGDDIDSVVYADVLGNYSVGVTTDSNGFITGFTGVQDGNPASVGDEGADQLSNVEQLVFENADGPGGSTTVLDLTKNVQLFNAANQLIGTFDDLKSAADAANATAGTNFTIRLAAGNVDVGGSQVIIDKAIAIEGGGLGTTTLNIDFNTAFGEGAGNLRGVLIVETGGSLTLTDVTIDGNGHQVDQAVRVKGAADVEEVRFQDIRYDTFYGLAISAREGASLDVANSEFANIGRVGVHFYGATGSVTGSSFTGKGAGDHLDYAVEAGAGANVAITNNIVTGNQGEALSDGSTSAAFLVTDYFAPGTQATITGNTVSNSTAGVAAGYLDTDASQVTFGVGNDFTSGVTTGVSVVGDVTMTDTQLVNGTFDWDGGPGANFPSGADLADDLSGGGGNDTLTGFGGGDTLVGGTGFDTATEYGASAIIRIESGHWVVKEGGDTDVLTSVERVNINGQIYLLVDQTGANVGGFQTVEDAILAASGNETILIAPGIYTESMPYYGAVENGLYINKAGLTLQGVKADGTPITSSADVQADLGPTIIAGSQDDISSSSFFMDVGATGTTLRGLHLQAGPESTNKLVEFWADDVTLEANLIDTIVGGASVAAGVYINEITGPGGTPINTYLIDGNILTDGIYVANGVGTPGGGISATQRITSNAFIGTFTDGRYDMVAVQGDIPGVGWQPDAAQVPTIASNTRADNSVPFIFRMTEENAALFPTTAQIAQIVASNTDVNTTYAYALNGGNPALGTRDIGSGPFHIYAVANSISTLNLGLDATPDAVMPGQRVYLHAGDTVVTQSVGPTNEDILVENLTVQATATSTDLNLTLQTELVDHTPIAGGGVHNLTLADYAAGQGANVDVTGNALDNVIIGNNGNNTLDGAGGFDSLKGGGGTDTIVGGEGGEVYTGTTGEGDRAIYDALLVAGDITPSGGGWQVNAGGEGVETLQGIEIVQGADPAGVATGRFLLVGNGGFASIQAAVDEAVAGDTILIAPGVYAENVTVNVPNVTLIGVGSVEIQGTFKSANGLADGDSVATFLQTAASYSPAGAGDTGRGVTIAADNVTIKGIRIDGFNTGIELGDGIHNARIENVTIEDTVNGIRKGTEADVNGLDIVGGSITDGYIGIYFAKTTTVGQAGNGLANNIEINGTLFQNLDEKGIYAEALSNALITGITMNNVGEFGRGPAFGGTGLNTSGFGNGIDINLKNGIYSNITITDFDFTNVGSSDGDGSAHTHAAAIAVKVRDDAPSYSAAPATWIGGPLVISDGTIDGTSTGIRLGEPGKTNAGPPVNVADVAITGEEHSALHGDVDNVSSAVMTIVLTGSDDTLLPAPTATGPFNVSGLDGNDTISGGRGDDTLSGGAGADSIRGGIGADLMSGLGGEDRLDGGVGNDEIWGGDGNDILIGGGLLSAADRLIGGAGDDTFYGNNFASEPLGAGTNRDPAPGEDDRAIYGGTAGQYDVTFNNTLNAWQVTAKAGAPEYDGGGANTDTLYGIEGIDFGNDNSVDLDLTKSVMLFRDTDANPSNGKELVGTFATLTAALAAATANDTIQLTSSYNVAETVTIGSALTGLEIFGANAGVPYNGSRGPESVLTGGILVLAADVKIDGIRIVDGGAFPGDTAGVFIEANNVDVSNTLFFRSGTPDGDGSRGIVTATGTGANVDVVGSSFEGWATGIYFNPGAVNASVSGNAFTSNFVGISNDDPDNFSVTNNTFSGQGFENVGIGVADTNEDLSTQIAAGNTFSGSVPEVSIYPYAGSPQDITGTQYQDVFNASGNGDTLRGLGGDDVLNGGAGADTLTGGAGADKFRYDAASEGDDHIVDFDGGEGDIFELMASSFGETAGTDATGIFQADATDTFGAGEKFHYNTSTGALLYDNSGTLVTLATLDNHANLTAQQIHFAA